MGFHRLTVPSYYGGLPGGYDYINNAVSGTPANANSVLPSGPNSGSYFVGFGDDGTSANANRPHKALSENTDYLDDLLHRDIAVPQRTVDTVAGGGGVSSIVLTGPVFIGSPGTPNTAAGINTFVSILDENDNEIIGAGNTQCMATAITGGTVGTNFSAGNVTLTVSPAIPAGKTYRVYYATRGNLATLPVDALTSIKVRGAQEVSAQLEAPSGAGLIGITGIGNWADATGISATTVAGAIAEILSDLSATAAASGTDKIGGEALSSFSGAKFSLSAGTLTTQIQALLDAVNAVHDGGQVRTITASHTIDSGGIRDKIIFLNSATGGYVITLPSPAANAGRMFHLINGDGTTDPSNIVYLAGSGEKINNVITPYKLNVPHGRWIVYCNGVDWFTY